ncbi:hypothetical protein F4556_004288 [Kitasatospora gansuensis]|uniref:Uncharacterized protein n=1 Tax=Kitasatospora gansuensis TaxID=258050 RepID=A0A7W7SE43_9ACTN|nr:hypothetical protein [Kitasatospora gansuensis]MBB4948753.1 hypothetical protein [Kitasatospora gansuensis]
MSSTKPAPTPDPQAPMRALLAAAAAARAVSTPPKAPAIEPEAKKAA